MDRLNVVRMLADTRTGILHYAESASGEKFLVKLVREIDRESEARLRYEARIFAEQYSDRIVAPAPDYTTQAPGDGLVLRYFDGVSLARYLENKTPGVVHALKIALNICKGLADLHSSGICHGDLQPRNILVDPDSASILIVDCSACHAHSPASEVLAPPRDLPSLPYLAPECFQQKLGASDERADLYALGVILYQLVTGRYPLKGGDLIEWRHAHLALTPPDAGLINPDVPAGVSDMIMSLLKKLPEERYQSASGLYEDLQQVIAHLEQGQPIGNPAIHRAMPFQKFRIPDTLYGRESCERDLDAALNRVIATRTHAMVLVVGESGTGKTLLMTRFCKRRENDANFAPGKFDQYSRHGPYRVLVSALSSLIDKVLRKGEREILSMRDRLLAALGQNAQLVTALVPSLELLIGPQPEVPDMPPSQAANRFRIVWRNFLRALAGKPLPLVLLLDDIQWADHASLDLLDDLVQDREPVAMLIVASFRKDDDIREPVLKEFLRAQESKGQALQGIETRCLEYESVCQLVRDVVRRDDGQTAELARRLWQSTAGNPLSLRMVLATLHDKGDLWFDRSEMRWVWNQVSVNALPLSASFLNEALCKLQSLDADDGYVISRAAFMGEEGSIASLSRVCGQSEGSTIGALTEAERIGFLTLSKDRYRFLHDRFREAAFLQLPQSEHTGLHLCIARIFMEEQSGPQAGNVFEPLYHFNMAFESISDPEEQERVGRLNLAAGQRARKANAYHEASQYYRHAVRLIDEEKWEKQYQYALNTWLEFAECEYFSGNPESATATLDRIENKVIDDADRARVYRLRIWLHEVVGRYDLALRDALRSLRNVGVEFPESQAKISEETAAEHAKLMARLEELDVDSLDGNRGAAASKTTRLMIGLLSEALLPAYFEDLPLHYLMTLRGTSLLLDSPLYPGASAVFIQFGYYMAKIAGNARLAGQFSDLAVRLSRKDSELRWRGIALILHADHVNPRLRHISTDFPYLEEGFQWCLQTGDLIWTGIVSFIYPWQAFEKGETLEDVLGLVQRFAGHAQNVANKPVLQTVRLEGQFVKCLMGRTHSMTSFNDDTFSESASIRAVKEPLFSPAFVHYHVMKQIVFFLAGDMESALRSAIRAHALLPQMHGFPIEVTHTLFYALTLIALRRSEASQLRSAAAEEKLGELVTRARGWAEDCPANCRHVEKLLLAEMAQDGLDDFNAQRLYEEAASNAKKGGFIQYEALANELAARFFMRRGLRKFACIYAKDAVSCYERWGARSKVDSLRTAWRELLTDTPMRQAVEFDSLAITRAIQAISSEIALDRLLDAVMRVVLQTAGAQEARLIVQEEDTYKVLAKAHVKRETVSVSLAPALAGQDRRLMPEVLDYVRRTGKHLLLKGDQHQGDRKPGSLLCFPLCRKSSIVGFIYLEHFDLSDVFDDNVLAVMEVICSQIAVSLENARLYAELANEVSLKRTAEQKFEFVSSHDPLTGLPNRKMLIDHLGQFIRHARQEVDSCAVLVVDLDRFKDINDSFGHNVGDRLLVLVRERLQHCCKDEGVLARLGSDEFGAIIPFLRSEAEPANLAQRILDVLALPFTVETRQLHLEACIGISLFPADGQEAEALLRAAETALYFAKQRGGGAYRFFEAALNDAVQKRLSLEHQLRNAFEQGELRLYYQPQVHLASSRIFSAEALLRYECPGQPAASCGMLLQAAEDSSLILTIGEWTIRQACEDLKRWHELGFPKTRVAVNLTPRQFFRPNFKELLETQLRQLALDPATLILEITEGTLMDHSAENYAILESISKMGIQLSIDDFGTGYSSLSYLQRFPVHELKIDQAFVRGIQQNAGDRALVSAIVAMGRSLHLEVLAEGVETSLQEDFLRSAGCEYVQGYLYGKAMPSDEFTELLMSRY